jgi:streptomycin 6-kinase
VLKLGVPRAEFERGIHALRLYAGNGACAVLQADTSAAAMLLERARPGEMLSALARAERLSADLLESAATEVLLHGDLHHFNILSARREPWLCIDPKGMRGHPGYEVGPFLLNEDHGDGWQPAIDAAETCFRCSKSGAPPLRVERRCA